MLLFPCNKIVGTPRLGFTVTNTNPSEGCFVRLFLNGQIVEESVLNQINTFIEIPIDASRFKIKFSFQTTSAYNTQFSVSNITWGGSPYRYRYPLCILKCYENDPELKIQNLYELWQMLPEQILELDFDNFKINHGRALRNRVTINGASTYLGLAKVGIVDNFRTGQGYMLSSVFQTWLSFEIWRWRKLRLKITDDVNDLKPNRHYIKSYNITDIASYFKFLHRAFGTALASDLVYKYV